jgi:tRNA A37 N6-isopentenylltransferase MiaA
VDEVQELLEQGYHWDLPAMSAVGYAEFRPVLEERGANRAKGETSLDNVMAEIQSNLHRFIRHQYNWFSLDDPTIHWFDASQTTHEEIEAFVYRWLKGLSRSS